MSKVHLEFSSVRTVQMFNQFFTYFPLKIIGTNYPLTVHGSISLPDNYFLFNEQQRDACINLSKHPHIVLGPCGMCIPVCMCVYLPVSSADVQFWMTTDRQADRQTDRQTKRQTDRQTDRQSDRQTDATYQWPDVRCSWFLCMYLSDDDLLVSLQRRLCVEGWVPRDHLKEQHA